MISVLVVYKVASLNCYFSHFSMIFFLFQTGGRKGVAIFFTTKKRLREREIKYNEPLRCILEVVEK